MKKKYGNTKADSDISSFLIKEIVTKAEIIWTLKTVMSAFSLGFRDSLSNCFQEMFLESKYPQNLLALAEQSFPIYKHMTFFHIFFSVLIDKIKCSDHYSVSFDESMNKFTQHEQIDISM